MPTALWLFRPPLNAGLLVRYARALVDAARLDDLGCLAKLVECSCDGRWGCAPMLREFADGVDAMVRERYGGRFHPLVGVRALLAQYDNEEEAEKMMEDDDEEHEE